MNHYCHQRRLLCWNRVFVELQSSPVLHKLSWSYHVPHRTLGSTTSTICFTVASVTLFALTKHQHHPMGLNAQDVNKVEAVTNLEQHNTTQHGQQLGFGASSSSKETILINNYREMKQNGCVTDSFKWRMKEEKCCFTMLTTSAGVADGEWRLGSILIDSIRISY